MQPVAVAAAKVETPRSFAFASTGSSKSWASIAQTKGTSNSAASSPSELSFGNSRSQLSRAQDLKKIEFDLESSRAGLNLAFKTTVSTAATPSSSLASSRADTPSTAQADKTTSSSSSSSSSSSLDFMTKDKQPSPTALTAEKELTQKQLDQRNKQIQFGKNLVGYKNYCHHVPKESRDENNERHPFTPKARKSGSKRAFAGTLKAWKKALHLWDEEGPFNNESAASGAAPGAEKAVVVVAAAAAAMTTTKENEAEGDAFAEKKMNMFERPLRSKSWADMADSDDSDSEEDEDQTMKPPSPEFQGLRTKRKATEELLPARMEKKANTEGGTMSTSNGSGSEKSKKPMSRALQLAKERAAARKKQSSSQ